MFCLVMFPSLKIIIWVSSIELGDIPCIGYYHRHKLHQQSLGFQLRGTNALEVLARNVVKSSESENKVCG